MIHSLRSFRLPLPLLLLVGALASCGTSAGDGPSPGVATVVTSVGGTVVAYAEGNSSAALADVPALGGNTWMPFGVMGAVSAAGAFDIALPISPPPGEGALSGLCGSASDLPTLSFLYTFTGSFDAPTITGMYANFQLDESADAFAFTQVIYAYSTEENNLTCREVDTQPNGPDVVTDVDLRLRAGWNVVSMFADSKDTIFVRSGETQRPVDWRIYSDTF